MLRPLQEYAEDAGGEEHRAADHRLAAWSLLVPQALALTIPMSLLLGLLVGFGRLSADREFVAMQACGISLKRLLIPVGLVSMVALRRHRVHLVLRLSQRQRRTFCDLMVNVLARSAPKATSGRTCSIGRFRT